MSRVELDARFVIGEKLLLAIRVGISQTFCYVHSCNYGVVTPGLVRVCQAPKVRLKTTGIRNVPSSLASGGVRLVAARLRT